MQTILSSYSINPVRQASNLNAAVPAVSAILEINNLHVQFDSHDGLVHAVNGISYTLREGETLGIVGESGCGKSVSMLALMRLLPQPPARVQADSIKFQGQELLSLNNNQMRHLRGSQIAMIFQDPMTSLNPVLPIGYQLREPLCVHQGMNETLAEAKAAELLSLVGIPDPDNHLKDYPHQFSGGMRQRAMIAMGLACTPSLLIADEPTTALDVTIQAQIVDLVKNLRDQFGMALIWITHDLGIVAGLADRVIVMYAGYIVEDAPVEELYERPAHPYTWALLRSLPGTQRHSKGTRLEAIRGMPPDLISLPLKPGCPFAPRCKFVKEPCLRHNPPLRQLPPSLQPAHLTRPPGSPPSRSNGNPSIPLSQEESNREAPSLRPNFATSHKVACWVDLETGELR